MSKTQRLLIVLADGEHARFVRPGADGVLRGETAEDSLDAHKLSSDLGSDRPGTTAGGDGSSRHALAPRHDPHALAKEKFARAVADQLNAAGARGAFDTLLLVAPAHALNTIRAGLNHATAARVVATLDKDLVKTPDHELASHLTPWVHPVRHVAPYEA